MIDLAFFRDINGLAGQSAFWDSVIVFCASYLPFVLGALLIILAFWKPRRLQMLVASLVAAGIAGFVVKPVFDLLIHRARPFVALKDIHQLVDVPISEQFHSFPSTHALVFFALAMTVYRYDTRWGRVFFVGAFCIGIARVIGGVHWLSDVVAGALIGMIYGWVLVEYVPWFRRTAL